MSHADYLQWFTDLIILKMADEYVKPSTNSCGDLPNNDIVFSIY